MRLTKLITVGIDIQDAVGIYVNLHQNLLSILTNKYAGRCFRGIFVESFDELVQVSPCYISRDGDPDHGTINVIARVTATVYEPGEIITGCKVIRTEESIISCHSPRASIYVNNSPALSSIREQQIISVRVIAAQYSIGKNAISVHADYFTPSNTAPTYELVAGSVPQGYLDDELAAVTELETAAAKVKSENASAWKFFADLMAVSGGATTTAISSLIGRADEAAQYITRTGCPRDQPVVAIVETSRTAAPLPREDVILLMFRDYRAHLQLIIDHVNIYNTPELVKSHTNLWMIMQRAKKASN